jgi:uncharacterized protein YdiU (UPF0061 family)
MCSQKQMERLRSKDYKKEFVNNFPGDESGNLRPRQTPGVLFSKAVPTPVSNPRLVAWSDALARELGIQKPESPEDIQILAGNLVTPSMYPYAACYAGHQFGQWAGQLGDGRAITLGEWEATNGKTWELQLKGAGKTPYSRRADGRAVLRSSLREYLMSEAMHYLRVPTTRALSLVSTGDQVLRDMFYNGNTAYEPGAIVMRVAPSFLRFGNFEILAAREELDNLRKLTDWTINKFYPHIQGENKLIEWFREVMERTVHMVVEWLRVGFVHGVMNTDNMSILGLTIDYGPYSFLDEYDPNFTPNTTDLPGRRYAFGKQTYVAYWNLGCLASALAPLIGDTKQLIAELEKYEELYWHTYYVMMGNKLGLDQLRAEDLDLINQLVEMLSAIKPDMTIFYQQLMKLPLTIDSKEAVVEHFKESYYKELKPAEADNLHQVIQSYIARIKTNTCSREASLQRMQENNPRFILRNYLLHQAIQDLENGDDKLLLKLQEASKEPYSAKYDEFFARKPSWAVQKAGCSMLSCSS